MPLLITACSKLPFGTAEVELPAAGQTAAAEKIVIQDSVTVTGNIEPLKVRELGFSDNGRITAITVNEGDSVETGTILAKIDASSAEYNIEAMEYELEQMRFTESPRKIDLKEKELDSLRKALENKIIKAPFDGVIVEIKRREGEVNIAGGGDGYLVKIIDDSSLKASVVVDELDISRIRTGQKAIFSFDALPGETFIGRVSKIAHIGRLNDNGLPVVDVELIIDSPDPRIFIPYSFKVEILTTAPAEYIAVPEKSVLWEDDSTFINVADENGEPIKREVKIKEWKDGKTIVLDGIQEGETVLIRDTAVPEEGGLWM